MIRSLLAALLLTLCAPLRAADDGLSVGLEGRASFVLSRGDIVARPLDDRAELIVIVDRVTPKDGKFSYDIHYIGLEPRRYDLTPYLMTRDGEGLEGISNLMVDVRSVLPADYDGKLPPSLATPFPWPGGYRTLLGVLVALWLAGFVVFYLRRPRPEPAPPPAPVVPPPSLMERLRPLLEAARRGELDVEGKARLESLLLAHWRELAQTEGLDLPDALRRLRTRKPVGDWLETLERWLHSPRGAVADEVRALLDGQERPAGGTS